MLAFEKAIQEAVDFYQKHPEGTLIVVTAERTPPDPELGERIKVFRLEIIDSSLNARFMESFGDTEGDGVLHKVESIAMV